MCGFVWACVCVSVCTSPQALRRPLEIMVRLRIWPSFGRRCLHLRKRKEEGGREKREEEELICTVEGDKKILLLPFSLPPSICTVEGDENIYKQTQIRRQTLAMHMHVNAKVQSVQSRASRAFREEHQELPEKRIKSCQRRASRACRDGHRRSAASRTTL